MITARSDCCQQNAVGNLIQEARSDEILPVFSLYQPAVRSNSIKHRHDASTQSNYDELASPLLSLAA